MKLYLDCAEVALAKHYGSQVHGFTTNPTLMRQAGVTDYATFVPQMLEAADGKPVSFEVIADDLSTMAAEAHWLAGFGPQVYVKIPITTSTGVSCLPLIGHLSRQRVQVNVTAVMSWEQSDRAIDALRRSHALAILSIFAGRIADTQRDPAPFVRLAAQSANDTPIEILWASAREVYNVRQAEEAGCHIITLTPALLDKLSLKEMSLEHYSLETVQMFRRDALAAGLTIPVETKQTMVR